MNSLKQNNVGLPNQKMTRLYNIDTTYLANNTARVPIYFLNLDLLSVVSTQPFPRYYSILTLRWFSIWKYYLPWYECNNKNDLFYIPTDQDRCPAMDCRIQSLLPEEYLPVFVYDLSMINRRLSDIIVEYIFSILEIDFAPSLIRSIVF